MIHRLSKTGRWLCLWGLLSGGATALMAQDPPKPTLAVLPFGQENRGRNRNNRVESEIYQSVVEAFFNLKRFRVIERAQLDRILQEGELQSSAAVDDASAVRLGKQLGAAFIVLGSFSSETRSDRSDRKTGPWYETNIRLSLRMVSTETGAMENAFTATGHGASSNEVDALGSAAKGLAKDTGRQISNAYPLSGYLIQVSSAQEGLLDLGKKDGVASGDIFMAFEQGADIVHPVTGKRIKGAKRQVSEFKVIAVSDETSTVKMVGDKIELKPGLMLESKPRSGGFFEGLRNSFK